MAAVSYPETARFLNEYLADLSVLYQKLRSFHWNVEGPAFFTLHAKTEEYYDEVAEEIDEVAERILMIGSRPVSTLKEYLERASLKEAPAKVYRAEEIVGHLVDDFSTLVEALHRGIDVAEKEGDPGTVDLLTGSLRRYEKELWMLKAFSA